MNINKFTQNSLQAVQGCEKVAYEYGNQEVEQEHLLYALIIQNDSLIANLIEKMGIQKTHKGTGRTNLHWPGFEQSFDPCRR